MTATAQHHGRLQGKCVLVTGAGTAGIGRGIALAMAREGADVAVHDHTLVLAEQTAALLHGFGGRVVALEADFCSAAAARELVCSAHRSLGRLDAVVANAGVTQRKPVLELTDEDMQRVIGVNLLSTMALTQEAAHHMVAAQSGVILIVSSINEERIVAEQAHYCASKGGLRQWGRALAVSVGPLGVRVNLLCPGAIDTPLNYAHLAEHPERLQALLAKTPLRRLGDASDLGPAAVFLISDESRFMTGASLFIDGGLSIG